MEALGIYQVIYWMLKVIRGELDVILGKSLCAVMEKLRWCWEKISAYFYLERKSLPLKNESLHCSFGIDFDVFERKFLRLEGKRSFVLGRD